MRHSPTIMGHKNNRAKPIWSQEGLINELLVKKEGLMALVIGSFCIQFFFCLPEASSETFGS